MTRGVSLPKVLFNIVRVLLSLPGFPPGVPPPHGFRGAARVKEDDEFVGVAAGEEKNAADIARSIVSSPLALPSPLPLVLPLPLASFPPPHLPETFRRQDTRRTSVKSGANALGDRTDP